MSGIPISQSGALRLQLAMLAGNEPAASSFELRVKTPRRSRVEMIGVRDIDRVCTTIGRLAPRHDVFVGSAPRDRPAHVARVWALHVLLIDPDGLEVLKAFTPAPSMLVDTDSGVIDALWQLWRPLPPAWGQQANQQLADELHGRPSTNGLIRPVSSINHGQQSSRPVRCLSLDLKAYTVDEIIGSRWQGAA